MSERGVARKAEKPERTRTLGGGTVEDSGAVRQADTARRESVGDEASDLLEEVLRRENMLAAYKRVVRNRGAAGVDGMEVHDLAEFLKEHWARIREELLSESYRPAPIRKVEIPKPDGKGKRMLGIPTVMDRMIQQALLQILTPIFDPTFSEESYGFRPGRSTHQAVARAHEHIRAGHGWVVDMDLEKFFDRVNHDVLMARVARRVKDKRVLRLIRRYLQAGMMEEGLVSPRTEGTPQGSPLSPLLSNILLDELDRELERRGHRFVRYADDCNIYVKSEAAGKRVLDSLERFLMKRLRLKVNREKSAVDLPSKRKFLGYTVSRTREPKLRVSPESVKRLRAKLKGILRRGRGRNLAHTLEELAPALRGWVAYYRLAEVTKPLADLDRNLRRHLRAIFWHQWKNAKTRRRNLLRYGLDEDRVAKAVYNGRGTWWNSAASHMNQAIPNRMLSQLGLVSLLQEHRRLTYTS
jgi:RNA-directed DNA polymerase